MQYFMECPGKLGSALPEGHLQMRCNHPGIVSSAIGYGGTMKIQDLRTIAKQKGVNSARMNKGDIIRAIQEAEGNFPCFGSAYTGYCDQSECVWRPECIPASVKTGAA